MSKVGSGGVELKKKLENYLRSGYMVQHVEHASKIDAKQATFGPFD